MAKMYQGQSIGHTRNLNLGLERRWRGRRECRGECREAPTFKVEQADEGGSAYGINVIEED